MTISLEYAEGAISSVTADQYPLPSPARLWVYRCLAVECYLSCSINVVRDLCAADTL
jgi:hypothetical protein